MKSLRFISWVFVLGTLLALNGLTRVWAETGDDGRWQTVASWRQRQGLLQDTIYAIMRSRDGYLWLGTRSGLCRFDGLRFTVFDDRDPTQIRENEVQALAEAKDGSLWVGTYGGGVSRYKDGKFTVLTAKDGLSSDFVVALAASADGTVWCGGDGGLTAIREGRFTRYHASDGLAFDNVRAVFADTDGSVWVCTKPYGLHRIKNGRITRESVPGIGADWMVQSVNRDKENNLWFSTQNGLFRMRPTGETRCFTVADGLPTNRVGRSVYVADDGAVWFSGGAGLAQIKGDRVQRISIGGPDSPDLIHVVTGDPEGNIWVALAGNGLLQLRKRLFLTYAAADGLVGQMVTSIAEDSSHRVWLGTVGALNVWQNGTIRSVLSGVPDRSPVVSLFYDSRGALWVGTERGLYRGSADDAAAGRPDVFTEIKAAGLLFIHAKWIFEDRAGSIWVGTDTDGLLRIDDQQVTRFTTRDGLAHDNVLGLSQDRDGAIWIGTRAGLNRFKDGHFTVFRQSDGLAVDAVEATYRDHDDTLWITTRHGLTRLKDGKFTTYTVHEGLFANFVHSLVADDHGYLWMASDRGPFRVSKQQLDEVARGVRLRVESQSFGIEDGLLSTGCVGGYNPSTVRTANGLIWFATDDGVSVVNPAKLVLNTVAPTVHLEAAIVDGRAADLSRPWVAPAGRGDLEFHYTGLSFVAPEKVVYRYQLEGYDEQWIDAGTRAAAYYSNIPPGHYRFHVIAANYEGRWNMVGDAVGFEIRPHVYETWWFYVGCAAGIVALGIALHWVRTRRLRAASEILARHVAERTEANERLQAEILERHNAERALRVSEERYRSFFEEDLAGAFIATPEGKIVACNPAFARIFGFTSAFEAVGLDTSNLYQRRSDQEQLIARLQQERAVHDYALEMRRVDGVAINVVANLIVNIGEDGAVLEVKGYVIDVSERIQLEAQLRQAQKMEAVGRLAGGIAHDFNNLLTGIIGYAQLLLLEPDVTPQASASAHEILNAGKLAAVLTRQLLTFSRRQVVQPQVLDLNASIGDLKTMLERLIGEDIKLQLQLSPGPVYTQADPGQMEQIIMNLAVNARDAMRRGGRLTLTTERVSSEKKIPARPADLPPGDYVKLCVRDTGSGMSADVQAHIFEPFFTTKPVGQGTGLGLSTVLGIVRQNKGGIAVQSAPGAGAIFDVWLPASPLPVTEPGVPAKSPGPVKFARVLVVEDNELVRETAAKILRREGYEVIEASSANDAVRLVANAKPAPDLVLTDVVMPDRNGRDLADELARLRPHLRVVFMSGYTDDAMVRYGLETHRRFVEKPFTAESLLRKMHEALSD